MSPSAAGSASSKCIRCGRKARFPEILVLDNHKDNPVLSTDVWHSDTTFRKNPTKYTILRCEIMPKVGGDTLFADMEAAYEGLSPTSGR